jgi:hypothetical protein
MAPSDLATHVKPYDLKSIIFAYSQAKCKFLHFGGARDLHIGVAIDDLTQP